MAAERSPEDLHPVKCFGWAARDTSGILFPFKISRRATGEKDVRFKILYCGVCHSDLHCVKNEWGWTNYPLVPGHEMVGIVTEVGSKVTKCNVGDTVGMGCLCGSCRKCEQCKNDVETYCSELKMTYLSVYYDGTPTQGGYSNEMVADEHFIINWPKGLPLAAGAPLLCAGATVYSPFKYYGLDKPATHVGFVGLGGLGHVAVKFAKAFGLKVTVISTSPSKRDEAINQLGADNFLVSRDPEAMKAAMGTLDNIFDSVSAVHPLMPLFDLLKPHGKLIMVGAPTESFQVVAPTLIMTRKMLGWSAAAGLKETQEMINFAAEHNIAADIEIIPVDYINKAMERLEKNDVKYRFVIDIANTLKED